MMDPPCSLDELLARSRALTGRSFLGLCLEKGYVVPNQKRYKGFSGQILECILGGNSNTLPEPDFPHLGVELKTLPMDPTGKVLESTYICKAHLPFKEKQFLKSTLWKKTRLILWIPLIKSRSLNKQRNSDVYIGSPLLHSLTHKQSLLLKKDWNELSEMLRLGKLEELSSHQGTILQLRPKAANCSNKVQILDKNLQQKSIVPQGFYLRSSFTQTLFPRSNTCKNVSIESVPVKKSSIKECFHVHA